MMSRKKEMAALAAGILIGTALIPAAHGAAQYLTAVPCSQKIYIDKAQVQLEAYNINGSNYVKLRDIGEAVDFNVYWDGQAVQVDSKAPYTGLGPASNQPSFSGTVTLPTDGSKYIPKTGDVIRCDDGTNYTITDVSRYDNNVFAEGPVGDLPAPTCDWNSFPTLASPKLEIRHFAHDDGDSMFIRNIYETRRMQYTIYNALGKEPSAWRNGKPLATVQLTIPAELEPYTKSFWPWRTSELEKLVHSRPNSRYYVEAWDYYHGGIFQYTRYCVVSL